MKKLASLTALAALALSLAGCAGSQHGAEESYVLVAANLKIPYWEAASAGLKQAATQLGVKSDVVGPAGYDPKAQREELRRLLTRNLKPSGILISPTDPVLLKDDIDAAIAQGIPVITIDSDAPTSKRLLYVGTDNYRAGEMAAQVAVKQLQGKGNVVVFTIPGQANLAERLRGYNDVFASRPQIKIVEVVDMKGDPALAFDRTGAILDSGKPAVDAFVCLEALSCAEVAEVLSRKQVTGKVVIAMDTHEMTLEGIKKGTISATVAQKPFTMAFTAVKMLDDIYHHKPASLDRLWELDPFSSLPAFVDTGATLIDKSNVEAFIRAHQSATAPAKK